jgi:hypothetical protein
MHLVNVVEDVLKTKIGTNLLFTVVAVGLVSVPTLCNAATTSLPWDYTLLAMQDMLVRTIAPPVIGFAFAGSVLLYAIGGHDEQAGRLFGSGIGGLIALAVVYFLHYVAF